ncbi:unnamed protein product [Ophioblennius macclurei]
MKLLALFLVLSLVVLMAEPGDALWGSVARWAFKVGKHIHGRIRGRRHKGQDQDQVQDFQRDAIVIE